jgi:serine/threonine protein kinase
MTRSDSPAEGACEREALEAWASRNGITTPAGLRDFAVIADVLEKRRILPSELEEGKEINRGSFGSIFAGNWQEKPVAIKHVDQASSFPQVFRAIRFELEAVAALKHPNIVQFHGISAYVPTSKDDDATFRLGFVFELCEEGSLFERLHRQESLKKVGFLTKMGIARDIARGMTYVHDCNVIHRDLSSCNVLFSRGNTVKICDFGCARIMKGEFYDSSTISGSPAYMPLEQLVGEPLTLKVDVYALGVIIWELLNEQVPWSDLQLQNDMKKLKAHIKSGGRLNPTPFQEVTWDPGARSTIASIMDGALEPLPKDRWSMSKLYASLKKMTDDHEEIVSEEEQRLQSLLLRFYSKLNPSNIVNVENLSREWQGRESDLNKRLRSQYKADLTSFESISPRETRKVNELDEYSPTKSPKKPAPLTPKTPRRIFEEPNSPNFQRTKLAEYWEQKELESNLTHFCHRHNISNDTKASYLAHEFQYRHRELNGLLRSESTKDLMKMIIANIQVDPAFNTPSQSSKSNCSSRKEQESSESNTKATVTGRNKNLPGQTGLYLH